MNQQTSQTFYGGNPSKVIQDRISLVERHFGDICQGVGGYVRTLGKLRNKGDDVVKAILTYTQNETHNPSTQHALKEFAANLAVIEDYRNTEVKRMEAKVIEPLGVYGRSCKQAKERIRTAFIAHEREERQQKTLDRLVERNPRDSYHITQAQTELQKASIDASKAHHDLEQEMDAFEKKKLLDIKQVMHEFVNIQLAFHAKALEYYSLCSQSLNSAREDEDLEEFRNSLHVFTPQSRQQLQQQLNVVKGPTERSSSSNQGPISQFIVSSAGTKPKPRQDNTGNRNSTLNSTNPSSMYSNTTQDDDDDDDEEDEDSDEDEDDDDDDTELPSQRGIQKPMTQAHFQVTPHRR